MPTDVLALVVYGSVARDDNDRYSDTDVCVVHRDSAEPEDIMASIRETKALSTSDDSLLDLSLYGALAFQRMLESGSLFGWHLALEGKLLYDRGVVANLLSKITPYRRASADILDYLELFGDVDKSLRSNGPVPFDLALLFTIARNTAMVLCTLGGSPEFGRTTVFDTADRLFNNRFSFAESSYTGLLAWKLWYTRGQGTRPEAPSTQEMDAWLGHVRELLCFAERIASER